ncbi:hypothetical protein QE250_07080 [Chromatiaceae bacterium AAb-1]|nr:hypothetical protein [Chromatiaceae bacterium AAb-1]
MKYIISTCALLCSLTLHAAQPVAGKWITDQQHQTLNDPQSSGLTFRHGELIHLSDNSAAPELRNKLLRINPHTAQLLAAPIELTVSPALKKSCFAELLHNNPDWESLDWDRKDDTSFVTVTEDSSKFSLNDECARRYADTYATDYPTLLVKIKTDKALTKAEIVAVRPVQFPQSASVGNFPNDGIEGLAFDDNNNLYLALEKNMANKPMIFKTPYTQNFWDTEDFVQVTDTELQLPAIDDENHPLNGMDFLPSPIKGHPGYLVTAARNDDQLWIFDLSKQQQPFVQQLNFYAPTDDTGNCPAYEQMVQTAIEGIAIDGDTVYMVNDPWKQHYPDNIQCPANAANFKKFAPLLFKVLVDPRWFIDKDK